MEYTSYIEISKSALRNNFDFIRSYIKKDVIISSVVKGDAYGHGIECFVPLAEECGINHFSVFSTDEAQKVLSCSTQKSTILIMGMIENKDLKWAIEHEIEFFVFDTDRLFAAIEAAKEMNKKAILHLEIETGLNRTGFNKKELISIINDLQSPHIIVKGICTHFAGAENIANYYRIKEQKRKFTNLYNWLVNNKVKPEIRHIACSAAAIRYPETQLDMIRVGILQYGFWPSTETLMHYLQTKKLQDSPLKRIISWKSKVMSVKKVKAGEFISYGTSFLTQKDILIATVPVGYSHGYSRSLSNQGRVIINGKQVNVIGFVNMNMFIVDANDIPTVKKGDEVTLIGKQGDLEVSVASFSELSNQLNYELLTRLPNQTPRKIID